MINNLAVPAIISCAFPVTAPGIIMSTFVSSFFKGLNLPFKINKFLDQSKY